MAVSPNRQHMNYIRPKKAVLEASLLYAIPRDTAPELLAVASNFIECGLRVEMLN